MPDIGRFFGVDPVSSEYMSISTYQFAHNNPIWKIELEGLEGKEKQGVDVSHHEPVKVVSKTSTGTAVGAAVATKVAVESTKKAAIELSKSFIDDAGRLVLQGSKFAIGTALGTAFAILTPTKMGDATRYDGQGRDKTDPNYPNVKGFAIDEKLRLDDKMLRPESDSDSPIRRISEGADSFAVTDSEDDTAILSHDYGGETIEIGGDFSFDGDTLTINNFDVEGSSSNNLGIKGIRAIMKTLGTELGVKTIITNGVPRTTGANPGKVTRLTFDIDKL